MSRPWTGRIPSRPHTPRELEELEQAVQNLERQAARRAPATGPVFQNVASIVLITGAALTATLAGMHVYDKLFGAHRTRRENQPPDHDAQADTGHQDAEDQRRQRQADTAGHHRR